MVSYSNGRVSSWSFIPSRATGFALLIWVFLVFGDAAQAQSSAASGTSSAAVPKFSLLRMMDDTKQPVPWFKWGADLRVRDEYLGNVIALNGDDPRTEQNWLRVRARLNSTLTPLTNLDFNVRLTWEGKYITEPYFKTGQKDEWDGMEGVFDSFNTKWQISRNPGAILTVGRQDMLNFGDGWLILEGTPLDGSRTVYFDAARLSLDLTETKTAANFVYIDQTAMNDRWLPPMNYIPKPQIEQDERGAILYVNQRIAESLALDGYFIYKHDRKVLANGDDADLYTPGGRVLGNLAPNLQVQFEGAYQFGHKQDLSFRDRDVNAYGLNNKITYRFQDPHKNQVRLVYEFLSGDDPDSKQDEMFDLLWGRWPRWSELYIYSYIYETRVSQVANLHRVGPGWTSRLGQKSSFRRIITRFLPINRPPPGRAKRVFFRGPDPFVGTC